MDIKSKEGYFFGNGNKIDLLASGYYRSNILPCKTTILGMLCFYYGIDFNKKDDNGQVLKHIFINDFEYGILNKSNSVNLLKKKYSSSFHRTKGDRKTQLYSKEFILDVDITIYINIKENSILFKCILENKNNITNTPGIGDKNLYPDIFNIAILGGEFNIINKFNGKILTNNFIFSEYIIGILGNVNRKMSIYIKRDDYNDKKREIISSFGGELHQDIYIGDCNIIIYNGKGIVLI